MSRRNNGGVDLTGLANILTGIAFCLMGAYIGIRYFSPKPNVNLGVIINNDGTCSKAEMEYRCASFYNRCIFYTKNDTLGPYGDDSLTKNSLTSAECKELAQKVYKDDKETLNSIISYEYYDTEVKYSVWKGTKPKECPEKNLESRMVNKNYQCNKTKLDNNKINK